MVNIEVIMLVSFVLIVITLLLIIITRNRRKLNLTRDKFIDQHTNDVKTYINDIEYLETLVESLSLMTVSDLVIDKSIIIPTIPTVPITHQLTEPTIDAEKERELTQLYYKGVPDKYINGKLIKGVEPDAHKAIYHLNKLINSVHSTEDDILQLAKIYHFGMHKFNRDIELAEKIYKDLQYAQISEQTHNIIMEALADINKIRTYEWLNLPIDNNNTLGVVLGAVRPVKPVKPVIKPVVPIHVPIPSINPPTTSINPPTTTLPTTTPPQTRTSKAKVGDKAYNDPQNTHDSYVLSTIKHSLEKIKNSENENEKDSKNDGGYDNVSGYNIQDFIKQLPQTDKTHDALKSLEIVISSNREDMVSSMGISEYNALDMVWKRINSDKFDDSTKKTLKETLVDELASMQEFGQMVCQTGRVARIVDTLNGVDDDVSIKPMHAINEEMMTKAAHIRKTLTEEYPENEQKQLEAGTSNDQDKFDLKLKTSIVEGLRKDYVDTHILTDKKFNDTLNVWIDAI